MMDLVQLFGSLISIAILAYVASRLFPAKHTLTTERVVHNISRYCPDINFTASDATVIIDKRKITALLIFPEQRDGLATAIALGDRVVVRYFPNLDDIALTRTGNGIRIDTGDFTQPAVDLDLDEQDAETAWAALNTTKTQGEPAHA